MAEAAVGELHLPLLLLLLLDDFAVWIFPDPSFRWEKMAEAIIEVAEEGRVPATTLCRRRGRG